MARVAVSTPVLQWAMERAGHTSTTLEPKFPKIQQWIRGEQQPTLRQLEQLSKATRTPLGYFFLNAPPREELPIPFFRTLGDGEIARPSPDLLETVYAMQRRQDWLREYLVELGHEPLPFVGSLDIEAFPTAVAAQMRQVLGLHDDWAAAHPSWEDALDFLRHALEQAGILVVFNGVVGNNTHRSLDVQEFRGFVLIDQYAPLVFVNNKDAKAAKMFTLAHELAHVFLGRGAIFDLRDMAPADNDVEIYCNKVAAEFLVPEARLRDCWPEASQVDEPFAYIARRFKVSPLVAARRAKDLSLISRDEFFDFYNAYLVDERRTTGQGDGGGDFYNNQNLRVGKRFALIVAQAAKEGRLSYHEAYQLTGMYGSTFDKYVASVEMGARP
ncbi:MAG: ImmA/IrrE family metallo-endopeptidase [Bacillota bacterium]|jgi:Zn-dependent peptidase ImmA (M78 family)